MCTAATYCTKDFYFGRTLDYNFSYGEEVVVTPRKYSFAFRHLKSVTEHYAMIGMACVADGYPLYYDAVNEKGFCIAGLNFVGNAVYGEVQSGKDNIAQFEFIPWILGKCACLPEAKELLSNVNLVNTQFSDKLPVAQLHWLIADKSGAITVESTKCGFNIYDNPVGVLTNNPPFEEQLFNLNNYMHLSAKPPVNNFSDRLDLRAYGRGMGALGLPGDSSSMSRFVRASFIKMNSVSGDSEEESVGQLFHILSSVEQQRGCCEIENGEYEVTLYTSCCNAQTGVYYYTTYGNRQITAVDMLKEEPDSSALVRYRVSSKERIRLQN